MSSSRSPLSRVVRVAALIAVGLWALYLIAGNLVLSTGWLERSLSQKPEEQRLQLDSAWTLWPGRVHVRGFRFRHAEEDLQLELGLDRATLDIELFALLGRVLHVRHLAADGMSLRLRRLLDDPAQQALRVRALPTFDGLPELPRAGPEETDEPSDPSRLWSLRIEGIEVRVRELWIDEFRYEGPGEIGGAFRFAPDRELEVLESRVELGPAPLWFGELEPIATRLTGAISGHVATLDVSDDAPGGWGVFEKFTLHGALQAHLAGLGLSRAYLRGGELRVLGGEGDFDLALHLERGRFTPQSRAEYRTRQVRLHKGAIELSGDAKLVMDFDRDEGRVRLSGSRIVGRHGKRDAPPAVIEGAKLELRGDAVDLTRSWRATGGRFEIERASVPDLRLLAGNGHGNGRVRFHGGSLLGRAEADLDRRGRLAGDVDLRGRGVQVSFGDFRVHGTGRASARFDQSRATVPTGSVRDAELELPHFSFATKHGASGAGTLSARAKRVDYQNGKPRRYAVGFTLAFPEADGVLNALEIADSGLPRIGRALVDLEDLRVRGSVRNDGDGLVVRLARAQTDGVAVAGALSTSPKAEGRFAVDLGLLEFDVEVGR